MVHMMMYYYYYYCSYYYYYYYYEYQGPSLGVKATGA